MVACLLAAMVDRSPEPGPGLGPVVCDSRATGDVLAYVQCKGRKIILLEYRTINKK